MAHKVLQIAFRWIKTNPDPEKLKSTVGSQGDDWMRLNVHVWYLWTTKTPTEVYSGLLSSMTNEDSVVIIPVDPTTFNGWAPEFVWKWFNDKSALLKLGL